MTFRKHQKGQVVEWLLGAAVVVVLGYVAVNVANEFESGGTGDAGMGPVAQQTCHTKCTWLREKHCENNRDIGWCFPTWGCGDEIGAHTCEE